MAVVGAGAFLATPIHCHLRIRSQAAAGDLTGALSTYDELLAWRGSEDPSALAALCWRVVRHEAHRDPEDPPLTSPAEREAFLAPKPLDGRVSAFAGQEEDLSLASKQWEGPRGSQPAAQVVDHAAALVRIALANPDQREAVLTSLRKVAANPTDSVDAFAARWARVRLGDADPEDAEAPIPRWLRCFRAEALDGIDDPRGLEQLTALMEQDPAQEGPRAGWYLACGRDDPRPDLVRKAARAHLDPNRPPPEFGDVPVPPGPWIDLLGQTGTLEDLPLLRGSLTPPGTNANGASTTLRAATAILRILDREAR